MKNNVVFRYSHRVENKKYVKKRQLRAPISIGFLAATFFAIGWYFAFYEPAQLGSESPLAQSFSTESGFITPSDASPYRLEDIAFPSEGQAAIGTLSYGVLQARTNEKVAPIASLTKVITALVILEKAPIGIGESGDMLQLTAQDEQYYWDYVAIEGTVTAVTAGSEMSQYEALQAMLLPSSNNIADTLVDKYFSSRQEYLDYANALLQRLGLSNTRVADASGFSPESVSTPSDMIIVGRKALQNPVIAEIVAQPSAVLSVGGEVPNYNALIGEDTVTGIKPGLTDEAGRCLLFSADTTDATGNTVTIIGVVMGIDSFEVYFDGSLAMIEQASQQIAAQNP